MLVKKWLLYAPIALCALSLNGATKLVPAEGTQALFSPLGTQLADTSSGAAQGNTSSNWQEGAPFLLTFPESPNTPVTFRSLPELYTTFSDEPEQTALEKLQRHLKKHPYIALHRPDEKLIVVGKHYDVQNCTDINNCTFLTALSEGSCPTGETSCAKTPAHHIYVPFLGEDKINITTEEPN